MADLSKILPAVELETISYFKYNDRFNCLPYYPCIEHKSRNSYFQQFSPLPRGLVEKLTRNRIDNI